MSKHRPFALSAVSIRNHRTGRSWDSPRPVKVFVDSGATMTVISPKALADIRLKTGDPTLVHARVNTVNGERDAYAMKNVSLCLGRSCMKGSVLVMDGISTDILVGSDFLSKAKCKVDFERSGMKCKGGKLKFRMER
jgi:predicted aspartyl protease